MSSEKNIVELGAVAPAVLAEVEKLSSVPVLQSVIESCRVRIAHLRATGGEEFVARMEQLAAAEFGMSVKTLLATSKRKAKGSGKRGRPKLVVGE